MFIYPSIYCFLMMKVFKIIFFQLLKLHSMQLLPMIIPLFSSILNTLTIKANNTNFQSNYNISYRALCVGRQTCDKIECQDGLCVFLQSMCSTRLHFPPSRYLRQKADMERRHSKKNKGLKCLSLLQSLSLFIFSVLTNVTITEKC